ncbi:hypothetical protein [Aurantimonas sp. VKM B-3413]|uniref:hypothetical protein n=1 Tax=Aurantimonas sp. VKM B-3413 TaxID=2779401 RepID=UPI001E3AE1EE|nr:hypothetical protein [Aurantimonas sp. VKM B-3413]MCB8840234.1 hypothetical protein [Aurantimonas sp. VKM B-3413]
MTKSELFATAHRLTRSVVVPGISYRATFGIALRELHGAKKMQPNNAFTIVREDTVRRLKSGMIATFAGVIDTEVGPLDVRISMTKTDTGSIAVDGDRLTVTGYALKQVEGEIMVRRSVLDRNAREAAAGAEASAHLAPIVGVSEKQAAYAEKIRRERYKMLIEDLPSDSLLARQDRMSKTDYVERALAEIETNTDAAFWLDHTESPLSVVSYLKFYAEK